VEPAAEESPSRLHLEIEVRTLLLLVGVVMAALGLAGLVSAASRPLGWGLACALVAALVVPVVDGLDRRLPHALSVAVVVAGLAITLLAAWLGIATTIVDNVDRIVEQAPVAASEIESRSELARDFDLTERVSRFADDVERRFGLEAQLGQSPSTTSTYLLTGILMVFFVVYGPRIVRSGFAQIRDDRRRSNAEGVAGRAFGKWTRYVWAAAAQAVVLTLVAWPLLWWVELPGPFVLALLLGVVSVIPYVGLPAVGMCVMMFAAATSDVSTMVAVTVFLVIVSLVEVLVVRPRIDSAALYVGPAVPLIVALLGWEWYGFGGALYGVMLAILGLAVLDATE
jgi:predicted PurR-regulated permease PerM